jgi:hypothetical protein
MAAPVETHAEAVERLVRSRIQQGFPRYVEDTTVLARIADLVVERPQPRPQRKARGKPRADRIKSDRTAAATQTGRSQ